MFKITELQQQARFHISCGYNQFAQEIIYC